jgi:SAM-dependent methyltransferase
MIKWLKLHLAKRRLADIDRRELLPYTTLTACDPQEGPEDFQPTLAPYEGMAEIFQFYHSFICPPYGPFLQTLSKVRDYPLRKILDLACGTGTVTRQLGAIAPEVVGLDLSEHMLCLARRLGEEQKHVRFLQGDFRTFHLPEQFQVAVCASDSLNYLSCIKELTGVFRNVHDHLASGGFFVLDCLADAAMRGNSQVVTSFKMDGHYCHLYLFYDPQRRVSDARAVCAGGVEAHRRIPIEVWDVARAAEESGLVVTDHFTSNTYRSLPLSSVRDFYVLRKNG